MATSRQRQPTLRDALDLLQQIAPLELAEEWDNVGLLLEPAASSRTTVARIGLTVDLTEPVLSELVRRRADLIVSYHPPIFQALRLLTQAEPRHRAVLRAIASGMAIYSPHTALDAAPGGINDWLAEGVAGGREPTRCEPITETGQGRLVELGRAVTLPTIVKRVKQHLALPRIRLAQSARLATVRRIALCAGAGGSVLAGVEAQVYLTGEMRHHDVLAAVENGRSVILCEHTNTERGYLGRLAVRLQEGLGGRVRVFQAQADRDPLQVV